MPLPPGDIDLAQGRGRANALDGTNSTRNQLDPMDNIAIAKHPVSGVAPLVARQLKKRCDVSAFPFVTTDGLADIDMMMAQDSARAALDFGAEVPAQGFNLFVVGASRDSLDGAVKRLLEERARTAPQPRDWVYLNNFAAPHRPIALALPPGRAPALRDAMHDLVEDLQVAVPAAFETEDYQARRASVEQATNQKQEAAFERLQDEAAGKGVAVIRTPLGFTLAPIKDGQVLRPEAFAALPADEQGRIQTSIQELEKKLEAMLRSIPGWDKERRTSVRKLNRETAESAVGHLIDEITARFRDLPEVQGHLARVRADLIENIGLFVAEHQPEGPGGPDGTSPFGRYEVNALVTQPEHQGAPVVEELHPTLANLVGRVEHISRQGVLATDFRLIKPGALHRANGGYLLLDARALLSEPFAWTALKRALKAREIRIENAVDLMSLTSTITLQPDPVPLDAKIVLFGERILYYLLSSLDPEFGDHFKILADFEDSLDRSDAAEADYARLVATISRQKKLCPLDALAVGRVIDRAARLADDAAKLTLAVEQIGDLLVEADFWARKDGHAVIGAGHIDRAIAQQIARQSRIRDRMQESILREIALVDTAGTAIGQVNGLSVVGLGGFAFGRPSRITARVSPGAGRVLDIEREVELGGPVHSKGVLILSGFLSGRFALEAPISLFASLVFEQSYGMVEGDSASSAELYTLLSALSEVPIRQDLAVTGSVNQHGMIQAIGGVNEKIEGFFDVCQARGLTGTQGVLIPASNVQHLMLRDDVVQACESGRFAVYPVGTIDEGITLLTGSPAGTRGVDGRFPEGTINRLVEDRLSRFAAARRAFASNDGKADK
jgi:lon-related putative ATP-dependent protease